MAAVLRVYQSILKRRPKLTQALTAGSLMAAGDVIAQTFIERTSWKEYSPQRTGRFFIFGTCLLGPTLSVWYRTLDKLVTSQRTTSSLIKMALDQSLMAPVVLTSFLGTMSFWTTYSIDAALNNVTQNLWSVLMANYKLWPAAQVINFYCIPLNQRVLFSSVIALFWNSYLSYRTSGVTCIKNVEENNE